MLLTIKNKIQSVVSHVLYCIILCCAMLCLFCFAPSTAYAAKDTDNYFPYPSAAYIFNPEDSMDLDDLEKVNTLILTPGGFPGTVSKERYSSILLKSFACYDYNTQELNLASWYDDAGNLYQRTQLAMLFNDLWDMRDPKKHKNPTSYDSNKYGYPWNYVEVVVGTWDKDSTTGTYTCNQDQNYKNMETISSSAAKLGALLNTDAKDPDGIMGEIERAFSNKVGPTKVDLAINLLGSVDTNTAPLCSDEDCNTIDSYITATKNYENFWKNLKHGLQVSPRQQGLDTYVAIVDKPCRIAYVNSAADTNKPINKAFAVYDSNQGNIVMNPAKDTPAKCPLISGNMTRLTNPNYQQYLYNKGLLQVYFDPKNLEQPSGPRQAMCGLQQALQPTSEDFNFTALGYTTTGRNYDMMSQQANLEWMCMRPDNCQTPTTTGLIALKDYNNANLTIGDGSKKKTANFTYMSAPASLSITFVMPTSLAPGRVGVCKQGHSCTIKCNIYNNQYFSCDIGPLIYAWFFYTGGGTATLSDASGKIITSFTGPFCPMSGDIKSCVGWGSPSNPPSIYFTNKGGLVGRDTSKSYPSNTVIKPPNHCMSWDVDVADPPGSPSALSN